MVARIVGHYQIVSELGAGGMGLVYRAKDLTLGREVALKFLPEDSKQNNSAVERLVREARVAATINHPNICTVYEIGEYEGRPFIAMELLEGQTLKQRVAGCPVPVDLLLDWAIGIAEGLETAHKLGILHRDIKPANLFITARGDPKLLDFGLAKLMPETTPGRAASPDEATATLTDPLTAPGTAAGTPNYMSPEQVRGEELDRRTDLFSMGAVLYEMATGRMPFPGSSGTAIGAILYETPERPQRVNARVPPELDRIISKALEKDRGLRYQDAADMLADLKRLRRDTGSGRFAAAATASAGRATAGWAQRRSTQIWLLGACVVLIMAAAALHQVINRKPAAPPFQIMSIERLTNFGTTRRAAISPDGKYLAFALDSPPAAESRKDAGSSGAERPGLWIRQLATQSELQIVPPADGSYDGLTFSPDGSYVYFVRDRPDGQSGELFEVPTLGGEQRKIAEGVDSPVSLSPDGKRFAFVRGSVGEQSLIVANLDGGAEQTLTRRKAPDSFGGEGVAWSPDGRLIAVSAYAAGKCFIMTLPAGGGEPKPLGGQGWLAIRQLAWLPDLSGVILIALPSRNATGQIWQVSYPGGKPRRITNDLNDYLDLSLTADSETLIAAQGEVLSNIWTLRAARWAQATQVTFGAGTQDGLFGLGWLPGGGILYASLTGGNRELWTVKTGSRPRQVTTGAEIGFFSTPSLCRDGHSVLFATGPLGGADVLSIDIEGGKPRPVVHGGTNGAPSCSPDGRWVYYNALDGPNYVLWRAPFEDGRPERLTRYPSAFPVVSPDGNWVAFVLTANTIGIIPASGGQPVATFKIPYSSFGGNSVFRWSPEGNAIDYIDGEHGFGNIWRQLRDGSRPRQITDLTSGLIFNFAWSADGKELAIAHGSTRSDVVRIRNFRSASF